MADSGLFDDYMSKYTMPSLNVMGGKDTEHSSPQFASIPDTKPVTRPAQHHFKGRDLDPWIGWTHSFDTVHRHRSASGNFQPKPMSADDLDNLDTGSQRKGSGFFQKIRDTLHI